MPSPTFETTLLNPSATLLAKLVTVFQILETHSEPFVIIKFSACPIFFSYTRSHSTEPTCNSIPNTANKISDCTPYL